MTSGDTVTFPRMAEDVSLVQVLSSLPLPWFTCVARPCNIARGIFGMLTLNNAQQDLLQERPGMLPGSVILKLKATNYYHRTEKQSMSIMLHHVAISIMRLWYHKTPLLWCDVG